MAVLLRKPLSRMVRADFKTKPGDHHAEWVVTLYPDGQVSVRAKRSRTEYSVPLSVIFDKGAEITARNQIADAAKPARRRRVRRGLLA